MIKKLLFSILFIALTSCSTLEEKAGNLKELGSIGKECPPKNERSFKHIFCKERK